MEIGKLVLGEPGYPGLLKEIYDPPRVLYYSGDLAILERPCVAIVGTRRMSSYGEAQAFRFARELSERGICVVSGLAYGIDKAAHEGALMGGGGRTGTTGLRPGGTIAVVAQGLTELQPAAHRDLARRIVAAGGLLLSEKAAGEESFKSDYLVRNRIIAGLCKATLVVEAPFKSGARNTAKHAYENGRDVLCIPGRIGDENSQGTNALIQEGARLVVSPQEVAEALDLKWQNLEVKLEGLAGEVFRELKKMPKSPAELGERFHNMTELYGVLGELELRGLVRFTKDLRYAAVL
jgi:DNA processing protein